jgi:hypothetical protein
MLMPWTRRRQAREAAAALRAAEHKAFLDALAAVVEISTASAEATREVAITLQTWLKMFQAPSAHDPVTRVHDDFTEAVAEAQRTEDLRKAGFPVDLSASGQIQWLLTQDEFPPVGNLLS